MEFAPVLSAGEIGAKKWLESRPAVAEGITMFGSLAVISAEGAKWSGLTSNTITYKQMLFWFAFHTN